MSEAIDCDQFEGDDTVTVTTASSSATSDKQTQMPRRSRRAGGGAARAGPVGVQSDPGPSGPIGRCRWPYKEDRSPPVTNKPLYAVEGEGEGQGKGLEANGSEGDSRAGPHVDSGGRLTGGEGTVGGK